MIERPRRKREKRDRSLNRRDDAQRLGKSRRRFFRTFLTRFTRRRA